MNEYNLRFLGSDLPAVQADQARFQIIPAPYEASVSYGQGTANGPDALLRASDQLEVFDGNSSPGLAGIFTQPPVDCTGNPDQVLERLTERTATALEHGAVPITLGGEHTVSYGPLRALHAMYGQIGLIQVDAHADLRAAYQGNRWSHACAMRRIVEDFGLPLLQLGNRAYSLEEQHARKELGVTAWDAEYLARHPVPENLVPPHFPKHVYITFDVDGLDPSILPDTGTPVPGGLGWYQCLDLLERACLGRRIIGFDVVELAPRPGFDLSAFTAALLVYKLMGLCLR